MWSTYLGGSSDDYGRGIALDGSGNIYVTGDTQSVSWVSGGWDSVIGGPQDAFVAKLNSSGTQLWSTYVGGTSAEIGYGIAVDGSGNAYVTGRTQSSGWVSGGFLTTYAGGSNDAFIIKFSTSGLHVWSSYLGGGDVDFGYGIAVNGNVYVAGTTGSGGWVSGGWDTVFNSQDGYVVQISQLTDLAVAPSNPGATAVDTDRITWTWQDNSDNETGFNVYDDPGIGPPSTLQTTTAADVTSWQHTGLSVNTRYALQVTAGNANGDSAGTPNFTAYTGIEPVSSLIFSSVSANGISVASANLPSNLASGSSGLYFANTSIGTNSGWQKDNTAWNSTGLVPNTPYTFTGVSRNGDGLQTVPSSPVVKYTLAVTPVAPLVSVPANHATAVHALDVVIGPGDGNPVATEYAIQISPSVGGNSWVQADGTVGASPVYRLAPAWDAVRVTGLAKATTYTFTVIAHNGDNVDTAFGPGGVATTADNAPPSAPVLNFPTVQSTSANLVCFVAFPSTDADGDTILYEYDWYVKYNGFPSFVLFQNGAPEAALSSQVNYTDTVPGDVWYCVVTPHDEEEAGTAATSPNCDVVLGGITPSFISLSVAPTPVTLGQSVTASGFVFPTPSGSPNVTFSSTSPSGVVSGVFPEGTPLSGGAYSKTFVPTEATEGRDPWKLTASWDGDSTFTAATSAEVSFNVLKASPAVELSLNATAVPLGYSDLVATVQVSAPIPASLNGLLSGLSVQLFARLPDGSSLWSPGSAPTAITDADGIAVFSAAELATAGLDLSTAGTWQWRADFAGNDNFTTASSPAYDLSTSVRLTVRDRAGYAIITVGRLDVSGEGIAEHNKTADFVYRALRDRGFPDNDIYYLRQGVVPATPEYQDIIVDDPTPTQAEVQYAISQWAAAQVNASAAPVYVIFVDHGSPEQFYLYAGDLGEALVITPEELDSYFDVLETNIGAKATTPDTDRFFIYGACRSGSFIPAMSAPGRTIITSSAADEVSHRGVVDPSDGVRDGEMFITELFRGLRDGKTFKESFEHASDQTRDYTQGPANGAGEPPQSPMLDDNGDGTGSSGTLSFAPGEDGGRANELALGYGVNAGGEFASWLAATSTIVLGPSDPMPTIEALTDKRPATNVEAWIEVKSSTYAGDDIADPGFEDSQEVVNLTVIPADLGSSDITNGIFRWPLTAPDQVTLFSAPGTYAVYYYLRDGGDGNGAGDVSSYLLTTVYRQQAGNQPPLPVTLVYPADGAQLPTTVFFAWDETTDPDGDAVTYRLEVAEDLAFSTGLIVREGVTDTLVQLTESDGIQDLTTYYWRVIPVDEYGASPTSNAVRTFTTNNSNPDASCAIQGRIKSAVDGSALSGATATLTPGFVNFTTVFNGQYRYLYLAQGTYTVQVTAPGFKTGSAILTLYNGQQRTYDFTLQPLTGAVQVTITPAAARTEGAQWRVDGGLWHDSGYIVNGLPVGDHTISYKTLTNWAAPANKSVTIQSNQTTLTTGVYTTGTGSLKVVITPQQAIDLGALWRVDGGAWQSSGATVSGLSLGTHTVEFKPVTGWFTPSSQQVDLTLNATLQTDVTYYELTSLPLGWMSVAGVMMLVGCLALVRRQKRAHGGEL